MLRLLAEEGLAGRNTCFSSQFKSFSSSAVLLLLLITFGEKSSIATTTTGKKTTTVALAWSTWTVKLPVAREPAAASLAIHQGRPSTGLFRPLSIAIVAMLPANSAEPATAVTASITTAVDASRFHPQLPLPDPIRSDVPGTWAFDTMSRRVNEEILERTWLDNQEEWEKKGDGNDEWVAVRQKFLALRDELAWAADTPLTYLDDHESPRVESTSEERRVERREWRDLLRPHVEKNETWLTAPWMVTEFYVYRRLVAATGYFDLASVGYQYDPFAKQKRAGLVSSVGSAEPVLMKLSQLPTTGEEHVAQGLALAASVALWGNKMDLSLWPASTEMSLVDVFSSILRQAGENLLHDDTPAIVRHCLGLWRKEKGGGAGVDIVVDNAGFELVTDLALASYLIRSGIARTVTFQLKSHPTFVSDALEKDLRETVSYYRDLDASRYPHARAAGSEWQSYLDSGAWLCREHRFWAQPYAMWDMTEPLRTDLATRCGLAIVKGDANYRRLLGDRKWDYSDDFQKVVGAYFPCPVAALRTLKAELGCGMDEDQVKRARELDANWLVTGRFGVAQFGSGALASAAKSPPSSTEADQDL